MKEIKIDISDFSYNNHFIVRDESYIYSLEAILEFIKDKDYYAQTIGYLKEKLNDNLKDYQFVQGIAEVIIYLYYSVLGYNVNHDININSNNKKNFDLQITNHGLTLNFEVKSPTLDKIENGKFHGKIAYRHPDISKNEFDTVFGELADKLFEVSGIKTQKLRVRDDTVVDCIRKASEQFNERINNSLNILVIVTDSDRMGDFMMYMTNPISGIFTSDCVANVDFSNIDYIALVNAAEGHKIGVKFDFNVFYLKNYICLIFPLHESAKIDTPVKRFLFDTFPNYNDEFAQFKIEYFNKIKTSNNGIDDDMIIKSLIWSAYLSNKHPRFSLNKI